MSLEAASKWFYLIHDSESKALFDEFQEIEGAGARIAFAKSKGYEFTLKEFTQASKEAWDSAVGELSDEQLEGVSGGGLADIFGSFSPGMAACYAVPASYGAWQNLQGGQGINL